MSVPPLCRLPDRPSLEQLRKQAKEHLDTLRATDPSANLAAAQHALAREYGFESWPKLVHHVDALQPHRQMLRPAELKSDEKLEWSSGRGSDVWALFQACSAGNLQTVQALIAKDRTLARAHYDYRKPLYFAVRDNRIDVARFLLEHDSNPIDLWVDDGPIEIARDRGYAAMERMLLDTLEAKFNASAKGEPVALALRQHDLKKMRTLLDAQPELLGKGDKRSNQPIHWATMTRQLDAIDELLRRGADINARRMDGARPIHLTNGDYFYRGWRDVPRLWRVTPAAVMAHLKAKGALIDLPTACHTGDIERVREWLRQDPTLANTLGDHEGYYLGAGSPLSNAAAVGRMDIVQLLLDHGADPNLPEEQFAPRGRALYAAVYHGHYEIAKLLLELSFEAKTEPERPKDDWSTGDHNWLRISPLHAAARDGDVKKAKKLLADGADLTARDDHIRSTPLAWAAKFGQLRMVKFLLRRGAPKSLPDDPPWATPRAWAEKRGHRKIADLL